MKFHKLKYIVPIVLTFILAACATQKEVNQKQINKKVLVFSKTAGFRHKSIPTGISTLKEMAERKQWQIDFTEDASLFNDVNLQQYQTIVFLNTTGDVLNRTEEKAFENYIRNGGGYMGIHAATDTEYDWPFYAEMIGAQFASHPKQQTVTLIKNKDCKHPATDHLPDSFNKFDEWYNFKKPVAKHANILLSLDESSYTGKRMGAEHPIAWYHTYEGGRVFYTGMGHTDKIYTDPDFITHIEKGIDWTLGNIEVEIPEKGISMLDKKLSNWDIWMGIPHTSVKNLEAPKFDNVMKKEGIPLGLHNDPKQVYSVIEENGEPVLKITGEIYGGLTSKDEFQNYHFSAQFKWGEKKWEPRLKTKRDSGIIYHAKGPHGAFWKTWMSCLEFQVQEGDCGDFFPLGTLKGDTPADSKTNSKGKTYHVYNPKSKTYFTGSVSKSELHEKPNGEWNTIEIYCLGDESIHLVNGHVVNRVKNARQKINGKMIPVTKGKIQIQSEAAEVYYKDIVITPIKKFPKKYDKL
ncbi:ThuA domain-containing protein [Wenyingzhuangia sp. 1_MG-2023]|nr:ThuA domain-containing protein [Wenyingzhuangia sp. 1_MG-2023]